jgi:hypothetical protein
VQILYFEHKKPNGPFGLTEREYAVRKSGKRVAGTLHRDGQHHVQLLQDAAARIRPCSRIQSYEADGSGHEAAACTPFGAQRQAVAARLSFRCNNSKKQRNSRNCLAPYDDLALKDARARPCGTPSASPIARTHPFWRTL